MSTFTAQGSLVELSDISQLENYFEPFKKSADQKLLGLEAEFLAVQRQTGQALPFLGDSGIESLLRYLARTFKYETLLEGEAVIALKRDRSMVTLEPGGQVELSAAPVKTIFEVEKQVQSFVSELKMAENSFRNLRWISYGIQPFSSLDHISWVPKERYKLMADHLGSRGSLSHWMMKMTATNQVSFDYENEADAMDMLRTVFIVSPYATAMFAHSNFWEGSFHPYQSKRFEVWQNTDPERTGILEKFLNQDCKFRDYLDYVLQIPMIFVVRDGKWISMESKTFADFMQNGHHGLKATLGDFELHLSTAFPEVRLKQYIEVRGMDAQSPAMIPVLAAFWKGIVYDVRARRQAVALFDSVSPAQRFEMMKTLAEQGLHASVGGKKVLEYARELTAIAKQGLARQAKAQNIADESCFLDRLEKTVLASEMSSADRFRRACFHDGVALGPEVLEYLAI